MDDVVAALYRQDGRRVFSTLLRLLELRLFAAEPLHPPHTGTTVRVRGGEVTLYDGPFAETHEMLAGFYLIDARDLNEAIQVAAKIPPARHGSIEVRPVRELQVG